MKHILVIEDNPTDQFLANEIISEFFADITIHQAFDGIEALAFLEREDITPEIILLDINMPRMDGHEFLVEFAKEHNGNMPIVAILTSSDQEEDKSRSMSYKFVKDYFIKPISIENISKLTDIVDMFNKSKNETLQYS